MTKHLGLTPEHFQRRPKVPAIIQPREITNIPGVKGQLPLRAGEVLLTPDEQQRLRSLGWQPGDPIPGNLPEYVRAFDEARKILPEEVNEEIRTTPSAPPGTLPTKFPQPIDISQLDDKHRAEIEAYLGEFKKHAPQIAKAMRAREGMDKIAPSIQKAIVEGSSDEGIEVFDSRKEKEFVDQALGTQYSSAESLQKKIDRAEGKLPENEVAAPPVVADEDPVEYADKVGYLTAIMGGKSFRKVYKLYGGRIKLVLRQLTTEQAEMVLSQVSYAARVGLLDQAECVQQGHLYWALLSLESIIFQGDKTEISASVDEFLVKHQPDTDSPTVLPELVEMMRKTPPLHHISVWRALQNCHAKFNKLVGELEDKADNSDFWEGIEV